MRGADLIRSRPETTSARVSGASGELTPGPDTAWLDPGTGVLDGVGSSTSPSAGSDADGGTTLRSSG